MRGAEVSDRDLGLDRAPSDILPAVINQTAAKDLFGDADPLGGRITIRGTVRTDLSGSC